MTNLITTNHLSSNRQYLLVNYTEFCNRRIILPLLKQQLRRINNRDNKKQDKSDLLAFLVLLFLFDNHKSGWRLAFICSWCFLLVGLKHVFNMHTRRRWNHLSLLWHHQQGHPLHHFFHKSLIIMGWRSSASFWAWRPWVWPRWRQRWPTCSGPY